MPRTTGGKAARMARRRWPWTAYLLCGLAALLFIQVTVPAFQQERALARELERAVERRRGLQTLKESYELKARALQEDPQERFQLYLEFQRLGLVR